VTHAATQLVVWLNQLANLLGAVALLPLAWLPGWLSSVLVSIVTGVLLLLAYKYTSNQRAVKRARDDIKAQLLSLSLFKDSVRVSLAAQGRIIWGALRLVALSLVPIAIMTVPVVLFLGQLALWYQARPLRADETNGEEAVVTPELSERAAASSSSSVELVPADGYEATLGPVRIDRPPAVCWNIRAKKPGYHTLQFRIGDETVEKELAAGEGVMRVSILRPSWSWGDALLHPAETPFSPSSAARQIAIQYPDRLAWTSGTSTWLVFWFAASMISAFCLKGALGVNV
jgi:hypothetical protein